MVTQGVSISELAQRFQKIRRNLISCCNIAEPGVWAEKELYPVIAEVWPDKPILFRWLLKSHFECPGNALRVLPSDNIPVLPADFVCVNGMDGLPFYKRGLLRESAIMACRIQDRKPVEGAVMLLDRTEVFHTGMLAKPGVYYGPFPIDGWRKPKYLLRDMMIGIDARSVVSDEFRNLVVAKLLQNKDIDYTLHSPPGAGAMGVLGGQLVAYVAYNPSFCDIAATAALCMAAGMIVCHLDGKPIKWNSITYSYPVVFARNAESFHFIRTQAQEYIEAVQEAHAY